MTSPPVPTAAAVASQLLQTGDPVDDTPRPSEVCADLVRLLAAAPDEAADGLCRLLLGRPPADGDGLVEALRVGFPTERLAYDLLVSEEGSARGLPHRDQLLAEVVRRLVAHAWGVPANSALDLLGHPDAAFVLAVHRVARGNPPAPDELAAALDRLVSGAGRETLLREVWAEGRAEHRLFGPAPRGLLPRVARRLQAGRRFTVFRSHVLAAEPSASAVLAWLSELPCVVAGSGDERASSDATLAAVESAVARQREQQVRLAEVAAGLRLLSGVDRW